MKKTLLLLLFLAATATTLSVRALPTYEPFTEYSNACVATGTNGLNLALGGLVAPSGEPWTSLNFSGTAGTGIKGWDIAVTNSSSLSMFTATALTPLLPSTFPGFPAPGTSIGTFVVNPAQSGANANIVGNSAVLNFAQDITRPTNGTKTLYVSYLFSVAQKGQTGSGNAGRYLGFLESTNLVEGSNTAGVFKTFNQMFNNFNTVSNRYFGHGVFNNGTEYVGPNDSSAGLSPNPFPTTFPETFNAPSFVVGAFTFTTGGAIKDTNTMWVNPAIASFGGPTPPASSVVNLTMNTVMSDVGGMVFIDRPGSGTSGGVGTNYVANLLIGSTWSYVTGGPEFTNFPVTQNVNPGGNATFSAAAVAAAQTVSYQWQKVTGGTTNNLTDGTGTAGGSATVSGSSTATLNFTGISTGDLGTYLVVATASGTGYKLAAQAALISDPIILTQPQSAQSLYGGVVTFTASAVTTQPTLTYAWYHGASALANGTQPGGSVVSGASGTVSGGTNTFTLTVSNVSYQDASSLYALFVTNNFNNGAFSSPASLTVIDPIIVTQPTNQVVVAGSTASFTVVANGSPTLNYQWYEGANPLGDGPGPGGSTITGSTSNTLTISGVNDANNDSYYVAISGTGSGQTTNSATVTLTVADPVTIFQSPQSRAERIGDHLAFTVGAAGGALNYQWQLNGTNLAGATKSALVLTNIQTTDGGNYTAVVGNLASTNSASASLTVLTNTVLTLASTNVIVARTGDGAQALSGATGNTIYLDQYTPNGTYVNTLQVPDEAIGKPYGFGGGASLTNSPALLAQGAGADAINSTFLTLSSGNQQYLDLAAYCQQYPYSGADVTVANLTNAWRGLSTIDAFGNYKLAYTNFGLYSGGNHTIRSMETLDGTNFWTTGQAGAGGVKFVNSTVSGYAQGSGIPSSSASATGVRVVQVVSGPITGYSNVNNLVCSDFGGLWIAGGTPEPGLNGSIAFANLINTGGIPNDFAFSPDNQTVYIADAQQFGGTNSQAGGIQRWDTNAAGGGWNFSYALAPVNGATNGAQGLNVYFPPSITSWGPGVTGAVLYATSYSPATNSLTQIVDVGLDSSATVITTAGLNQALRGVRFGPTAIPVGILVAPVSQTNFPGNNVTFTASASGTPPYFYQWHYNGGDIAGATKSSLTVSNLTFGSAGNYSVTVSNPIPSTATSSNAVLTITAGAPTFALGVQSYVETVGDHLAFAPVVNGTLPLNAQWYLNNLGNPIAGATNLSLVLANIQTGQSGTYILQVSNVFGSATSSGTLTVTVARQALSSNNLVVARIGDGAQALSGVTGNTLYLDQYTPAGAYVNTIQVPDEGTGQPYGTGGSSSASMPFGSPALLVCGGNLAPNSDAPFQAILTRSQDGQTVNFAGYCEPYPFAGPDLTVGGNGSANWRGVGGVNAFGFYTLSYTNTGLYSGGNHQIHAAITQDQTNFWTTGEAGTGGSVKYVTPTFEPANGGGIPAVGGSSAGTRGIQIFGGNLDFVDVGVNPAGIYQFSGLPQNTTTASLLIAETNSPMDFAISPDANTVYIADNGAFGGTNVQAGGIQRWDSVSGVYTYRYTLPVGNGAGARGLTVDFSAQPAWGVGVTGAKIYATTAEATGNRLVRITDNGASSTATTFATASAANILGGVQFGPAAIPVSIVSQPQNAVTLTGSGASFSVVASGSAPFYYQWQFNGTNLAGASGSSLTVGSAQAALPGSYTVIVSNALPSTATSSPVSISFIPILTFNNTGAGWSANGVGGLPVYSYNGGTNIVQLTQNVANQGSSTFFEYPVYVGGFLATWTYQVISPTGNDADGMAFVVQNDPRGPTAIGAFGGFFAYGGTGAITPSAALEFNLFTNASGIGVGFATNGAIGPKVDPTPVSLDSGNPINVSVRYLNGQATLSLFDTVTSNSFTTNVTANIPAIVGSSQAYVGLTGADGGTTSSQTVSNFVFISLVNLTGTSDGISLTLTWPTGVGAYHLQQSTDVSPSAWVNSGAPVTVVNGQNQAVVPISGGRTFYRLVEP